MTPSCKHAWRKIVSRDKGLRETGPCRRIVSLTGPVPPTPGKTARRPSARSSRRRSRAGAGKSLTSLRIGRQRFGQPGSRAYIGSARDEVIRICRRLVELFAVELVGDAHLRRHPSPLSTSSLVSASELHAGQPHAHTQRREIEPTAAPRATCRRPVFATGLAQPHRQPSPMELGRKWAFADARRIRFRDSDDDGRSGSDRCPPL